MRQGDFDSINAVVRAFRLKVIIRELQGTHLNVAGGSAMVDFIEKLKPAVRQYVQDNAPKGWFQDVKQAYAKALNYELNGRAELQCDDVTCVSSHVSPSYGKSNAKREFAGKEVTASRNPAKKQRRDSAWPRVCDGCS